MSDEIAGKIQPGFLQMPKLPVAGLFVRLMAFLLDLFLILSAIHLLSRFIPGVFWALDEWSPYITALLTFLYFSLLNGPIGKGRTLGKILIRIQTTDFDGDPPTFRQAAIRTVVLIPIFVTVPIVHLLFGEAMSSTEDYLKSLLTVFPFVAMLVATSLTIPFNPFKQGIHDFFAQTLVRPTPEKGKEWMTFEEMTDRIGLNWPKFHRQPQYSGGVTFAIIFGLLAFMAWPTRGGEEIREFRERFYALKTIPGFKSATIRNIPVSEKGFTEALIYQDFVEKGFINEIDEPTTGTLNLYLPVSYNGEWPFRPDSPELNEYLDLFADTYHNNVIRYIVEKVSQESQGEGQQQNFREWKEQPINLHLVFTSTIWLYPYFFPLEKAVGHYEKKYPPIEPKESRAEAKIPLEPAEESTD